MSVIKITAAKEMARVERLSIEEGACDEKYMLDAAAGIEDALIDFISKQNLEKEITLLVGKGNNGGDAYVVGTSLLKKGFSVLAFCVCYAKECSKLNQKHRENFTQSGGKLHELTSIDELKLKGVILDGLLGTGFQGKAEGLLGAIITKANESKLPILAIDIPSGLDGNTGVVNGPVINAKETIYLGLPKVGFFIEDGFNHVGKLTRVDFGMDPKYYEMMKSFGNLLDDENFPKNLPEIKRSQHKYEAGYVLAIAGSKNMPGAALLCTLAALRSGAGIIRLFHREEMHEELANSFEELIKTPLQGADYEPFYKEVKRAKSLLIGPGCGKSDEFEHLLIDVLSKVDLPTILDADALEIFAKKAKKYPKDLVLTPHKGEMAQCLGLKNKCKDEEFLAKAQAFAEAKKVVIILKGAPTFVIVEGELPTVMPMGDPGMATAGSGDVLSGVVAALLAMGLSPSKAAITAVYIHAKAGELAAKEKGSYSLIASDLIEKLPVVLKD
ncbi:bifunctional ADP-dependent NAD(P)H-hydrate dehydratase/NAD(P)H-hydrate epimerase [Candidatus Aerophobetes bacterium]|uniref:ADP-dependent (S)-NAD(P)H-hydrate dehydratase n=1 Tax=Aerophobetes bacterium TaxID=2030807 RepID=A0A2A4YKL5_UNCAE|nr:MAG: bifunctional ADP-dependent NAD(P)H-hydrate dehydratase/NAD(P)H-hydrate epimerase [Candidatus Aerophobetes bacterium]